MEATIFHELTIPSELGEQRLDMAVSELLPDYSRSRIQAWIKAAKLKVNGQVVKPKHRVISGDIVIIDAELERQGEWQAQDIQLEVVYEDEHLLVINKAAGFVVHPAAGHADGTIVNAVLHHCPDLSKLPRAGIVHRLDKGTTGLMVIAKTPLSHTSLVEQLQTRTMGREYEAVVFGEMTGGGLVDEPLGRHPQNRQKMAVVQSGKPAVTHYRVVRKANGFTHVRLKLESGRTHQIRVHMTHIRYPIIGDPLYGGRPRMPKALDESQINAVRSFKRQALHAKQLRLHHPITNDEISWEALLPEDMQSLIEKIL